MSISITRYVDITSGVGGINSVAQRSLVLRVFTSNSLVPVQTFVSFTNPLAVGNYFGTGSEEYLRAVFYFSFLSKNITVPQSIQFARWTTANTAPSVISAVANVPVALSAWNAVSNGSLGITIGAVAKTYTGIVFSSAQPSVTTTSSVTVTGLTSTALLVPGMSVSGTGIDPNAVIATVASSTSITLSIAAIAGGTNTLTFAVVSYPQIAAVLQKAINAAGGTTDFTAATVTVNGNGQFVFTGGVATTNQTPVTISIQAGSAGTDITGLSYLGWLPAATYDSFGNYVSGAITSSGLGVETVTQTLATSANVSNNFGSFLFLNNLVLSLGNAVLAAAWNTTQNNTYMFCVPVTSSNYATWAADSGGLGTYAGTALTLSGNSVSLTATTANSSNQLTNVSNITALSVGMVVSGAGIPSSPVTTITAINTATLVVTLSANASASATVVLTFILNEYPEQIPSMVLAATDYTAPNSAQNYMFQGPFAGLTPLVTTDADANTYDAASVNYYGSTQQAGQSLNFYQTGVLQGTSTSPLDMTAYTNEMWLKDAITVQIMNLFLGLSQIPANSQGRGLLLTAIQAPISLALINGSISVNKLLTTTQKSYITSVTNDDAAWYQVQDIGYWLDCQIVPPVSPATAYTAEYTLVYSKDDVIRLVNGTDILI